MIRLLIVDDSPLMRRLLGGIFEAEGDFIVDFARDGAEAIDKLHAFEPQVITLDINMPRLDGIACLDRIMVERPCPVVMVSARTEEGAADTIEAQELINAFTVNETYFYREEHQLRCLSRSILPEVTSGHRPGDRIRIWSVPCSTGEEPYSIALWLLENWPMVDVYHIEIVGSDIDSDAVAAALRGLYGRRSLARLPAAVQENYFEPEAKGQREIIGDLKESVKFTSVNLVDAESVSAQGRFDVIFCRNLLI